MNPTAGSGKVWEEGQADLGQADGDQIGLGWTGLGLPVPLEFSSEVFLKFSGFFIDYFLKSFVDFVFSLNFLFFFNFFNFFFFLLFF